MGKLKIPSTAKLMTKQYKELKGVDFSAPPTECKPNRSPNMVNMISDNGGNPVKRYGWRYMSRLNQTIYDIKGYKDSLYVACSDKVKCYGIRNEDRVKLVDLGTIKYSGGRSVVTK